VFAKGGANVVVNDMSKDNAEKVVKEIKDGAPDPPLSYL
jgi:hypothetical protein